MALLQKNLLLLQLQTFLFFFFLVLREFFIFFISSSKLLYNINNPVKKSSYSMYKDYLFHRASFLLGPSLLSYIIICNPQLSSSINRVQFSVPNIVSEPCVLDFGHVDLPSSDWAAHPLISMPTSRPLAGYLCIRNSAHLIVANLQQYRPVLAATHLQTKS